MGKMNEPEDLGTLVAEKDIPLATQLNLIKRRTERGMKPVEIARLMGIPLVTVRSIVKTNGWHPKRDIEPVEETTERLSQDNRKYYVDMIRHLSAQSRTADEIAVQLQITSAHVRAIARQEGIKLPRPKPKIKTDAVYRSREVYDELSAHLANGMSKLAAAKKMNLSNTMVHRCIQHFEGEEPL